MRTHRAHRLLPAIAIVAGAAVVITSGAMVTNAAVHGSQAGVAVGAEA